MTLDEASNENSAAESIGTLGAWLKSGLAAMAVILALAGGVVALVMTPREEEPQIDVPLIDVFVQAPGLTAEEVERRIVWPMEQTLFATRGVEYVYSSSAADGAIITARFYVGENPVESEVRVRNRLERNRHRYSPELADYQIRPVYVDDVPFMTVTLHSKTLDDAVLLSVSEELLHELTQLEGVGLIFLAGGRNEAVNLELDPQRMASHGVTLGDLQRSLRGANARTAAGRLEANNRGQALEIGRPFTDVAELENLVVSTASDRPVMLGEVSNLTLGPVEPTSYVDFRRGPAAEGMEQAATADALDAPRTAVTLALAKRSGANAVSVAAQVRDRLAELEPQLLGDNVELTITRDYGQAADDAVNWLVWSLLGASVVVMAVLAATLGWRESLIVAVSVPTTFAVALLVNFLVDFSLNRVTLFALIVALGLIVDDSIVSIDNIHRYLHTAAGRGRSAVANIVLAVREVLPPMILTSLVVIVAFVPMAFVTGLMGPYMAPMALTVPVAMAASTAVAALIVPWLAQLVFAKAADRAAAERQRHEDEQEQEGAQNTENADDVTATRRYRMYRRLITPLLDRRGPRRAFILGLVVLLLGAAAMPLVGLIPLKLLPYDNAEKLQFVIDLPEDATLERTAALSRELAAYAARQSEVVDVTAYAGTASPVDFNGLVRRYYLRDGPHVGDVRLNLIDHANRDVSSHDLALRVRGEVRAIAASYGATLKVVERPPGPPVLASVVAEVAGPPGTPYRELRRAAEAVASAFADEPGVVDVDTSLEAEAEELAFVVDQQKAALAGLTAADLGRWVAAAVRGVDLTYLKERDEIRPRPVRLRLPEASRTDRSSILDLPVARVEGRVLTLGELGSFESQAIDQTLERKNLQRVVYVTGEVAGITPTTAVFALGERTRAMREAGELPDDIAVRLDTEGEWYITRRVFRDLGIAFGVAVLAIFALLVYQTRSYLVSLILLTSVPLTIIGIMPGFWLLNAVPGREVAGFASHVPFTATGMIGMIALAGIAVRNAILLIDFIQIEERRGTELREAVLRAGALRVRPILLTAGTAMLAVIPIAFDPVFAGLAWSLIFGL
ncbi:MAG: efflux RND transporter permease subunit, partial [Phycisphaeraceae bacterium]